MPKLTKALTKEHLQVPLDARPELKQLPPGSPEFKTWRRNTRVEIENTFEDSASRVEEFHGISFTPIAWNALSETSLVAEKRTPVDWSLQQRSSSLWFTRLRNTGTMIIRSQTLL